MTVLQATASAMKRLLIRVSGTPARRRYRVSEARAEEMVRQVGRLVEGER